MINLNLAEVNMASSKEYLEFILEQLAELEEITYRAMMGEYIIYYGGTSDVSKLRKLRMTI